MEIEIEQIHSATSIHLDLLLLADPSMKKITELKLSRMGLAILVSANCYYIKKLALEMIQSIENFFQEIIKKKL